MVDTSLLVKPERWNGEEKSKKNWRFITRVFLMAALHSFLDILERAENGGAGDSALCAMPTQDEARHSRQLYNVFGLLVT